MKHNILNPFNEIHPTILALRYFYNTFTISFLKTKARDSPFSIINNGWFGLNG